LLLVQLKLAQYGQALFDEGVEEVEDLTAYTGWAGLGVKPFHKEKIINAANSPADTAPSRVRFCLLWFFSIPAPARWAKPRS
jgi:hypothetical protein